MMEADIVRSVPPGVRIIDMLAAQIIAGGGDAAALGYQHLDDLIGLEGIAHAHRPILALVIDAMTLDVAAGRDAKIREAHFDELPGGVPDRPALDHAAGIDRAVGAANVEIARRFLLGLFTQGKNLAHARGQIALSDLAAIETGDFAVVLEGTELPVCGHKFREHRIQVVLASPLVQHSHADGHAHDDARLTHWPNVSPSRFRPLFPISFHASRATVNGGESGHSRVRFAHNGTGETMKRHFLAKNFLASLALAPLLLLASPDRKSVV